MRPRSGRRPAPTQLARSHSTGHSLAVRLDHDLERFTLRLPEHVRREMIAAGEHNSQLRRGRRAGEGSSRGGRNAPLSRLGRWQSLITRTFSRKLSFFSASRMSFSSDWVVAMAASRAGAPGPPRPCSLHRRGAEPHRSCPAPDGGAHGRGASPYLAPGEGALQAGGGGGAAGSSCGRLGWRAETVGTRAGATRAG
ncbi:E3 ubiquitin-protein ligase ATL31-like [Panicum miliaceum]|uniref:E3 ubiquitin-protein ligase ATL31-like n=1 Tax=Panicum miliaceum TaxID=4540 RepID=A0A3L6RT07_PANMI|nr:E3 ubiquitin-protein ligase ATL31-like [Panicum miliaceum]